MKRKLVLDYDGTITKVKDHLEPYLEGYTQEFSKQTGISVRELERLIVEFKDQVSKDPTKGWIINDVVVAPATAEPYMLVTTIFQEISEYLGVREENKLGILINCHKSGYSRVEKKFKEETPDFLKAAKEKYAVFIASNSPTEIITNNIAELNAPHVKVIGDAGKFRIEKDWERVPTSIQPLGFVRPIALRRKDYHTLLSKISPDPKKIIVVGDIYEMDLALPEYMGARVIQVGNGFSEKYPVLNYERAYMQMQNSESRSYAKNLTEVAKQLGISL